MSYCRFGWDGSDVYVFTSGYGIECCGCTLQRAVWVEDPGRPLFGGYLKPVGRKVRTVFKSNGAMINHLRRHQRKGHRVPESALQRLMDPADAAENRAIWRKYKKREGEKQKARRLGLFVLHHGHPMPADSVTAWATWFEEHSDERQVALDEIGTDVRVSTVFLGMDYGFGRGRRPVLYETMVFGGDSDHYTQRYHTREEAEAGHRRVVKEIGGGLDAG